MIGKRIVLITLLFMMSSIVFSQNKELQVKPYVGFSSPIGDFKNFSNNGFVFGFSMDKYLGKAFALGLDFNVQSNGFKNPYDFSVITNPYTVAETSSGNWSTSTITFGPTYRIGSTKFNAEIYSKAGMSYTKSPNYDAVLSDGSFSKSIFNLPEQKRTSFGLTSGIRFNYKISSRLSLFLNPQYVYSSSKVEYCNCGLNNLDNPDLIVDQEPIKETISPSFLNLNAGLTWSLGGNSTKSDVKDNVENEIDTCPKTTLLSNDKARYLVNSKIHPDFVWRNNSKSVKSYEFRLYANQKMIYSKKTNDNYLTVDKKLNNLFKNINKEKQFEWNIITAFNGCETQVTPSHTFSIRAGNQIEINVTNIECLTPAYDSSGVVRYKGKVEFKAGINNSDNWIINNLLLVESSTTIPITSLQSCGSSPMTFSPTGPLTLPPGGSEIWCFEISVPIGSLSQTFQTNGSLGNGLGAISTKEVLKSCICDICDEWDIIPSNKKFWSFPFPAVSNMRLKQDIKILNAAPIMKVDAEIISVQHVANDEQCYTCTKDHNKMGLFASGSLSGKITSINGWQNNGIGELKDLNSDGFGNLFTWKSQLATGVDFATTKTFEMNISLPELSKLECCHSKYKVCIRYTFTDVNCQTCSELVVCYDYDSKTNTTSGGVGTGIGNQSSGGLTPSQINPKKDIKSTVDNSKQQNSSIENNSNSSSVNESSIKMETKTVESIEGDLQNDGGIEKIK